MAMILRIAWLTMTLLRFGGVAVLFSGVALFGIYFISGNAKAARGGDGRIPSSSWRGAGPRKALRVIVAGATMLLGAFIIGLFMPHG
jgi:hypothetical protein